MSFRASTNRAFGRVALGLLRLAARVAVAVVVYDLARDALSSTRGSEFLALAFGGILAGAVTILVGKFLYDTFLPLPRVP